MQESYKWSPGGSVDGDVFIGDDSRCIWKGGFSTT
jgi:hypothetical protein